MNSHRFVRRPDRFPQGSRSSRRRAVRPALEALDERCLLSTFTVETLVDNGNNNNPTNGSLRQANQRLRRLDYGFEATES